MKLNKLLERQIRKFLPGFSEDKEALKHFLNAVNDSYNSYERDHELSERAFRISEEEYININEKLKSEAELKKISVAKLKEAISNMGGGKIDHSSDDLLDIVSYLELQVDKRKTAEHELLTTANRLSSLIINMQAGILVEDDTRHIALTNQFFCDLFNIPATPEMLQGADCSGSAEQSKDLFKEPEKFMQRIDELMTAKKLAIADELELKDGRYFERDYIPIFIDEEYKGNLWKYRDITERKIAEEKLRASEELWQFALEGAGDGVWEYNFQTGEVFFSPQYKKMLGYEDDEFANDPNEWLERIHPDDKHIIQLTDKDYYAKKIKSHQREYRIRHKNGEYIWVLDRGMIINYTPQGNPGRIIGTHTDITQRKLAEEELRRLSLVASTNKNGVVFTSPAGPISWCNEGFCQLTGFTEKEIIGKTPVELLKGAETDKASLQLMIDLFTSGQNFDIELICYRKDRTKFWGRTTGQSVYAHGKVQQYFAMVEDITAEKEAQQKLQEFEYRFRVALEKIGDNVWEYNFKTGKTYLSNSTNHLPDYGEDQLQNGKVKWWEQLHPDDKGLILKNETLYRKGSIDHHTLEYRIIAKDGTTKWILDRGVVIEKNPNGKPLRIMGTHTDITERKLSEQALQINEEKYRSIITNMNLGLLEVDNDERIQYANHSFCGMAGYDLDEIIGRKASILFARGENHEMIETKNELRRKGLSDAYEIPVKNKRGELRWWLISGAPRYNDKGDLVGSIGIHLDITEQKKLEYELYDAREAAELSARAKESFLANMSHEIRTPMNAILGMSRQLGKTILNERQQFFLDTIDKAAGHLLVVINDILDISKIEAGKLGLERIGFKPDEVINHCVQVMMLRAEEKGLTLIKKTGEGRCPVFIGDPHRLTQILLNLVSNAVKFTEKGSVTVACNLLPPANKKQTLVIRVKDTGIGMDKEFRENLFQKFTQEDKTIARKYGGTGLGMSISKQFVELMKGSIEVKSEKGKGTEITVAIPFTLGTEADLPQERNERADSTLLNQKRILLAEDNEMNRLVATTVLKQYGAIVIEAVNGQEAIKELKQADYDLVLMDVQMPVMDGLEATRIIRTEISEALPIIALTANAIKGESDRCIAAGMNDFVSKPFEEEDLINAIAKSIGKMINKTSAPGNSSLKSDPLYDLSKLNKISNGNPEFVTRMINLFLEQLPVAVSDIKTAHSKNETATIKSIAHKIKPGIDNMGIVSLHKVVRDIENYDPESSTPEILDRNINRLDNVIGDVVKTLRKDGMAANGK